MLNSQYIIILGMHSSRPRFISGHVSLRAAKAKLKTMREGAVNPNQFRIYKRTNQ